MKEKEREALGIRFKQALDDVDSDRERLLKDTWLRAQRNYEGKEPQKQFPWPGASNAVLNQTAAYADDISARLYNAGTAHDPMALLTSLEDLGIPNAQDKLQDMSRWIEKDAVRYANMLEEAIPTFVIYGDAWIYLSWEKEVVKEYRYDRDTGELEDREVPVVNRPVARLLHPKDFYIPCYETDEETATWCGYAFDLDELKLSQLVKSGSYDKKLGEKLLERLRGGKEDQKQESYFKEYAGGFYTPDTFSEKQRELVGLDPDRKANCLRMVHIFARLDIDNDGIPEEINFHIDRDTGIIPFMDYTRVYSKRRHFFHFYYQKRVGCIYNKGVAELLFNAQKILNTLVRDLMDNNKVQNTKMFLARKGANFEKSLRAYPGRVIFVENLETDFKTIDMGTGRPLTGVIEMISLIQQWGERAVGITEANLGREGKSRTPLGTTLSLIQEGAKRVDRIIERMRVTLQDLHYAVLELYLDHGDPNQLAKAIKTDPVAFTQLWSNLSAENLREKVALTIDISSSSWNRSFQRQELLALYGQMEAFARRITEIAAAIGQFGNDPTMRELFMQMAKSGQRLVKQVVDTYDDIHDPENVLPDFAKILENVTNAGIVPAESEGSSTPAEAAQGVASSQEGGFGPAVAPGRPPAGIERASSGLAGIPG